jgi:transcription antitermination factor NusG
MFCRFDPQERLMPILTTPGIVGIVSAGKTPIPIPDEEIGGIRDVVRSGLAAHPWPFLEAGCRVRIEHGTLAGLEGILTDTGKIHRLVVSVTLLQRSVAVEIDREWARPI